MTHVIVAVIGWLALSLGAWAQAPGQTVVFWERGFPAVDTAPLSQRALADLPHARLVGADGLPALLESRATNLLVLPYGSAFPEAAWPAIQTYLSRGGNLLALGGRPFTRAAWRDAAGQWKVREPRKAFIDALYIHGYTETPGSAGLAVAGDVPAFAWQRAWSLTVQLSVKSLYDRIGTAGALDMRLDPLLWGSEHGHRMAAPAIEIDHLHNTFVGGRWVLVPADVSSLPLAQLAARAAEGAQELSVEPRCALYLPGETPTFIVHATPHSADLKLELTDVDVVRDFAPVGESASLPAPRAGGLHTVTARFFDGGRKVAEYRTGYWVRDVAALRSGPQVTVDGHYFRIDGRPQPIVGTTYMASDVQRQYLMHPNPFVWDKDFAEMRAAGIDLIRTGLWTAWDKVIDNETSLRNLEAFLLTARRYNMPVQFTFFAFMPDIFGGANAYLDPAAVAREQHFVAGIVTRFKDAPWLMWDLINEPSFDQATHLWATRPNVDAFEEKLWDAYVRSVHGDTGAMANAWNTVPQTGPAPRPTDADFSTGSVYQKGNPLMVHDFYLFAQQQFVAWARGMREAIRATGSKQLITVGQDEGGGFDRLNPSYWVDVTDFTTNHSWWQNDALLWDSLVACQPGKPALIQETGVMNEFMLDRSGRRSADEQARLLERKCTVALGTTAGVIQWLWNVNADMTEEQENTIGVVRPDGTDKPEAAVMRGLAAFANTNRDAFREPRRPDVAILFDQDLQYSPLMEKATVIQRKAVRVLHNYLHVPAFALAENRWSELGDAKLAILPTPQVLDETAWQMLLAYVRRGGTLLITGPFDRDAYWRPTGRMKQLGLRGDLHPLNFRQTEIAVDGRSVPVSFGDEPFFETVATAATWQEVPLGRGRVLFTPCPVELSEGNEATTAVYAAALQRAGVVAPYEVRRLSPGILLRPIDFVDARLYLVMSERATDENIDVRDRATGAALQLTVPAQRAGLLLLDRAGHMRARYGL